MCILILTLPAMGTQKHLQLDNVSFKVENAPLGEVSSKK